jgi:voltage-gated sodium channel
MSSMSHGDGLAACAQQPFSDQHRSERLHLEAKLSELHASLSLQVLELGRQFDAKIDAVESSTARRIDASTQALAAAVNTLGAVMERRSGSGRNVHSASGSEIHDEDVRDDGICLDVADVQQPRAQPKYFEQVPWHASPPGEQAHQQGMVGDDCGVEPPKVADTPRAPSVTSSVSTQGEDCETRVLKEASTKVDSPEHWIEKPLFRGVIMAAIILNAVQMGYCVRPAGVAYKQPDEDICAVTDQTFTAIFVVESILSIAALKCMYFKSGWHLLDFIISWLGAVDLWVLCVLTEKGGNIEIVRILRLLRVVRLLRMLKLNKNLTVLVEGLIGSFQAMGWIAVLMMLFMYGYAIMMVMIFGDEDVPEWRDLNFEYFDTLPDAMFTLFNMGIAAEWSGIIRPLMRKDWFSCFYFLVYIFMAAFGLLNLIIGVITERANNATLEWHNRERDMYVQKSLTSIKRVADAVFAADKDGCLTVAEMDNMMNEYKDFMNNLTSHVELPHNFRVADIHHMLTSKAYLSKDSFVEGMTRLLTSNDFQRDCLLQLNLNHLRKEVQEVKQQVSRVKEKTMSLSCQIATTPSGSPPTPGTFGGDPGYVQTRWLC